MQETTNKSTRVEYLRTLSQADIDDLVVLESEIAEQVLTDKRTDIVEAISNHKFESVRELARHLERDVSVLHRDLQILQEAGVVELESNGRAKSPKLAHRNVFVEPVVFNGGAVMK